jgi:hypothetical protein
MRRLLPLAVALAAALLAGCDMLGIDTPEKVAAAREADGKAIGGACRHAGRAIEDCFALNRKADRAAVFAGWRDMNDYMRENKIEPVAPQVAAPAPGGRAEKADAADAVEPSERTEKVVDRADKAERPERAAKADKPAAPRAATPREGKPRES